MIRTFILALAIAFGLVSVPTVAPLQVASEEQFTWEAFHSDAVEEYADEFTALFNSYETKWSKNGRLMIRQGDSGSFKFVAKGK